MPVVVAPPPHLDVTAMRQIQSCSQMHRPWGDRMKSELAKEIKEIFQYYYESYPTNKNHIHDTQLISHPLAVLLLLRVHTMSHWLTCLSATFYP